MRVVFIYLFSFVFVQAAVVSLQECIDKALQTHPDIKVALFQIQQSYKEIAIQKSIMRPQLSLYAKYDISRTYVMPQGGAFHTIDENGWGVGIALNQRIYDFSKTSHMSAYAKTRHQIAKLSFKEAKALMRYQIRLTYATILLQKAAIRAYNYDVKTKEAYYRQAKALVKAGLKTKADESRFLAALYQSKKRLTLAKATLQKALKKLEYFTGEKFSPNDSFEEEVFYKEFKNLDYTNVIDNNIQIQMAKKHIKSAYELLGAKEAERFGSLDLVMEANRLSNLSHYNTTSIALSYKIALYNGGRLTSQIEQSKIAALIAKKEEESKKRAIYEEVDAILIDLKELQTRIEAQRAQIDFAIETKKIIEARYKQGLATYVELLDAQTAFLQAKLELLEAFYERLARYFRLEYLNGK